MLWSTLAQMQTWFGAEAWKVYGIQVRCVVVLGGGRFRKSRLWTVIAELSGMLVLSPGYLSVLFEAYCVCDI